MNDSNLIEIISNANVLMNSFLESRKNSSFKNSVQQYELNFLKNFRKTQNELRNHTYKQGDFYTFFINERGKERYVRSICFYDRVIQRALCDQLTGIIYPHLIYDNGASVNNKGIDFSRKRIETHLHKYYRKYGNQGYILLIDFKKFYDNIDHEKLMKMYEKVIEDKDSLKLIEHLIDSFKIDISSYDFDENTPFDSLDYGKSNALKSGEKYLRRSLGIGSQISQLSGLYFPHIIDDYCKIVKGIKFYGRYMDDTYIISNNKEELKSILLDIRRICKDSGIFLNDKKIHIFRIDKGFTFLKIQYRLTDSGHLVRKPVKSGFVRQKRKMKSFKKFLDQKEMSIELVEQQYSTYIGNIKKYDCYKSIKSMDKLYNELFSGYKKKKKKKHHKFKNPLVPLNIVETIAEIS